MKTIGRFLFLLVTLSFADAIRVDCDFDRPYRIEIHTRRVFNVKRVLVNGLEVNMDSVANLRTSSQGYDIRSFYRIDRIEEYKSNSSDKIETILLDLGSADFELKRID